MNESNWQGLARKVKTVCVVAIGLAQFYLFNATVFAQNATPLFQQGISDWTLQESHEDHFAFADNVLNVSGKFGWLRSPRTYTDFEISGQVRFLEPSADSGIFLRVEPGTDFIFGWPGDAYQVQMREISINTSDNPLPLVNLYRHRVADGPTEYLRDEVFELYTGVNEWQEFRIRVVGENLSVMLNGTVVTQASGLENPEGYIGFQSEFGSIEYRNMVIHEF